MTGKPKDVNDEIRNLFNKAIEREGKRMPINSRAKGARAERNLASKLRDLGYDGARRGQQFSGANGDADVEGLPGIHIEAKHVEKLNIHEALAQSERDARPGEKPVVMHKKNNTKWLVTMTLDEWIELYREWEAGNQ